MRSLSFRARLSLWHTAAVASFLVAAAFAAHSAFARLVLGQLDAALVALAETEAAALQAEPPLPIRVHELAPGVASPSFVRLDRFVQIVDLGGNVLARSANLGTARLPLPASMLDKLRDGQVAFETAHTFGDEPVRLAALPVRSGRTTYGVQVAGSLDDALARPGQGQCGRERSGRVITVTDDGPGIAPDDLPRLFGRFHRGAAARAGEAAGFGLGVAISRAVIEREGGTITAENRPEGGARFSLRLRLAG